MAEACTTAGVKLACHMHLASRWYCVRAAGQQSRLSGPPWFLQRQTMPQLAPKSHVPPQPHMRTTATAFIHCPARCAGSYTPTAPGCTTASSSSGRSPAAGAAAWLPRCSTPSDAPDCFIGQSCACQRYSGGQANWGEAVLLHGSSLWSCCPMQASVSTLLAGTAAWPMPGVHKHHDGGW